MLWVWVGGFLALGSVSGQLPTHFGVALATTPLLQPFLLLQGRKDRLLGFKCVAAAYGNTFILVKG